MGFSTNLFWFFFLTLITVKILGTNHEISYWPFCDAAIKLRPIIISVSIFLSFMIVRSAILSKD